MLQQKLLEPHKNILGEGYIFDGSILFLQQLVRDCDLETPGTSVTYKISIKKTTEIHPGGTAPLQLYNMIFRNVFEKFHYCPNFSYLIHFNKKKKKDIEINEIEAIGSSLF